MVTNVRPAAKRKLDSDFCSPVGVRCSRTAIVTGTIEEATTKRSRLSSPMSPHVISGLRDSANASVIAESVSDRDNVVDGMYHAVHDMVDSGDDEDWDKELQSEEEDEEDELEIESANLVDFNLLIPVKDFA